MKTLVSATLIIATAAFSYVPSAFGADTAKGAEVFRANCAQCHAGGGNFINQRKTLKKPDLEKYDMYSAGAIIQLVTKGKDACPSFSRRLKPEQIENVAAYVLAQADKDWK
jgi:cytochrome c6